MPRRRVPSDEILRPLITQYFNDGLQYSEIAVILNEKDDIEVSVRLIENRLRDWGLQRRYDDVDLELITEEEVAAVILENVDWENRDAGYRKMTLILRQEYNLHLKRDRVYRLMKELDPEGVARRKKGRLQRRQFWSKGPNHTWSCDGHDKLKPYGVTVYGWIDCWSRKLLKLRVHATNNDPRHIAADFLNLIEEFGGIPERTSTDCGTETTHMAAVQKSLHVYATGILPPDAHIWTTSPHNQRIECLWSQLMKAKNIRLLDELALGVEAGIYNARDPRQKLIFQYIWIPLIQRILDKYLREYNGSRQRFNKNSMLPTNVAPNFSYYTPDRHSGEQCLIPIPIEEVDRIREQYPEDLFEYMEPGIKEEIEGALHTLGIDVYAVTLATAWTTFSAVWSYMTPAEEFM